MRNLLDALGGLDNLHHRSSYECGECKEGSVHLTLTLTTIFCHCQQTVQLPPVPKPFHLKQTTSPKTAKTAKKCFNGNYITTMYFVLCIVCCIVYCLFCITVLCCANNHMPKMFQRKLYNNYVFCAVYIVCCVVYCLLCITILCCANNQMQIFNKNFNFFHKNITIYFL